MHSNAFHCRDENRKIFLNFNKIILFHLSSVHSCGMYIIAPKQFVGFKNSTNDSLTTGM
jgi:hypothetical protein